MNMDELKTQMRWVCFDKDKTPINPYTGSFASSTDPKTWTTYAQAKSAAQRFRAAGVGFVFNGDGIVGIDLDDCLERISVDENGEAAYDRTHFAKYIMEHGISYAEVSPSKTGIHIIGTAKISKAIKTKLHDIGVEVYSTARYFTYTEDFVGGVELPLGDIQGMVKAIEDAITERDTGTSDTMHLVTLPEIQPTSNAWVSAVLKRATETAVKLMEDTSVGNRHNMRLKAGKLLGGYIAGAQSINADYITDSDAVRILLEAKPPTKESYEKEKQAIQYGINVGKLQPITIPSPPTPITTRSALTPITALSEIEQQITDDESFHLTDLGNGRRLVGACKDMLCYVSEWKQWLVWDGRRWAKGDDAGVIKLAHKVALSIYDSISDADGIDTRKEITKWAVNSESAMRIDAMIKSARPYLTKSSALFDTHPHLLNVANGTINLKSGQLQDHDPKQMITRLIDIAYGTAETSQRWTKFLRTVFRGDDELADYVQRAVGYTLTGHTDEHCLFFCYGDGANGKSTFMSALEVISSEYATTASIEALLEKRNEGDNATPTVAGLVGMRLATAQEMPDGKRFDESLIKSITGGDSISARMLYGSIFTFKPTHTLWLTGNHKPRINGTDAGIWRRIRIVPFTANIPEAQRRDSRDILREFQEDAASILQWAVLGAYLWYKNGLGTCEAVTAATTEYRGEEDIVARFLQTMCIVGDAKRVEKSMLYAAWKQWAEDEGERAASYKSQRWVLKQLELRNLVPEHDRRFVYGVGLIQDRPDSEDVLTLPSRGQNRRGEV